MKVIIWQEILPVQAVIEGNREYSECFTRGHKLLLKSSSLKVLLLLGKEENTF